MTAHVQQVHGGIGFALEGGIHRFYRRAKTVQVWADAVLARPRAPPGRARSGRGRPGRVGSDRHTPAERTSGAPRTVRSTLGHAHAAVLLADPEPSRASLERNLREDGFDVVEAGWSAQALDIAERPQPDIVLAGEADLCARLRDGEPGRAGIATCP